jgi:hypothetical protein
LCKKAEAGAKKLRDKASEKIGGKDAEGRF